MLITVIHLEISEQFTSQNIVWKHTFNSQFNQALWMLRTDIARGEGFESTKVTGVAVIHFGSFLVACKTNFLGIDDDDVITGVDVRSKDRLVLAAQTARDFRGETAENNAFGVDH